MTSMLNFFFNTEISPICIPEMTIISGHTKITFDKNDKNYYNYEKGVICFNEEFDLKKKQDINNEKYILKNSEIKKEYEIMPNYLKKSQAKRLLENKMKNL